jgi:hypothetical protein
MKAKIISNRDGVPSWDEIIIRCACMSDHFAVFEAVDITDYPEEGKDWWVEVNIVDEYRPTNFWGLLKAVWQLFRQGRFHRSSVELSRESLEEVRDWCQGILDKTQPA